MEKGVITGIDLSSDYAQISYMDDGKNIMSVPASSRLDPLLIPTVLFYDYATESWSGGIEAQNRSAAKKGVLIEDVVRKIAGDGDVQAGETRISRVDIAAIYLSGLLDTARSFCKCPIEKVVISIERADEELARTLSAAMRACGAKDDDFRIITHSESFIYYTLSQVTEIWVNRVLLIDLNDMRCSFKRLFASKGRKPLVADVFEGDISDFVNMKMLESEEGRRRADEALSDFLSNELSAGAVSAIYFTGSGFDENWCPRTLNCARGNRRVFKGRNLISKGAGYAAREMFVSETLSDYVFSCPGRIQTNVFICAVVNGKEKLVKAASAGESRYLAGTHLECILDRTNELKLVVNNPVTHESRNLFVSLSSLPKRPNKATRISIDIEFTDDTNFSVTVKDMGFGDFFEASDVVITENFSTRT